MISLDNKSAEKLHRTNNHHYSCPSLTTKYHNSITPFIILAYPAVLLKVPGNRKYPFA